MKKEKYREKPAVTLLEKCMLTSKTHQRCVDDVVGTLGIYRAQHKMLLVIADSDEKASQAIFARELGISTAAVAVSLRKLEKEGYITRETNGLDARRNNTALTEKGKAVLERSREKVGKIDEAMLRGLSEEQLKVLGECMDIMQANLAALRDDR